jgi:hypothetical protein
MPKSTVPNALFQPPAKKQPAAPKPQGPQYEVMEVTPELAEKWLAQNTHNRNARPEKVYGYARDMETGNWAENGEAIKFAADGTLLDGQHRLMAITLAQVNLRVLVVTGLPKTTQETMDAGAKRTLSDALLLRGEKYNIILAAVIKRAVMWNSGSVKFKSSATPTTAECMAFLAHEPRVRESAELGSKLHHSTGVTSATLGFTHWLFAGIDAEDARWFFDRLASGAELAQYHPVWTLRKRFADDAAQPSRMPEEMAIAFLIKGWNAYRAGDEMRLLRYTPGGANPEKFPMPK